MSFLFSLSDNLSMILQRLSHFGPRIDSSAARLSKTAKFWRLTSSYRGLSLF